MTVALTIQSVLLVLLAVFVVGLLRSHAQILRSLAAFGETLRTGEDEPGASGGGIAARAADERSDHPAVSGTDLDMEGTTPLGDPIAVTLAGAPQLSLLAFLSTTCGTCLEFWRAFAEPGNEHVAGTTSKLVIVTKGPEQESPDDVARLAPRHVEVVMSQGAWERYEVPYAPYFVLVDGHESRVIGDGVASSYDELRELLAPAMRRAGFRPGGQRSRREVLRDLRRAQERAETQP